MNKIRKPREHSLFLKGFRSYIQYVNSSLYFHKEHVVGLENVPVNGTPMVVVSNHQNCLNDPLCVCLKLTDRRMNFLARANVFKNPIFNKALRAMGLLPAYRMGYEGLAAVSKNQETIDAAGDLKEVIRTRDGSAHSSSVISESLLQLPRRWDSSRM